MDRCLKGAALSCFSLLLVAGGGQTAFASDLTMLQESRALVARSGAWQTYTDHIHIKPGQEKRALILTLINGADGGKMLTDLTVDVAGKPFASMKDLDAAGRLTRPLSGLTHAGNVLLTAKVFGASGARLKWTLSAEKVKVTAVKPDPFALGDKVTVTGTNFSENAANSKVLISGKAAKVLSSTSTELVFNPPSDLGGGRQDLVVSADSIKSDAFKVGVKGVPQITWIDFLAAPPGQPITISGHGFSKVASENVVTIGAHRARVVSATESGITCVVPEMRFPQWHVPINVTTNGARAKGKASIHVDVRLVINEGIPMH